MLKEELLNTLQNAWGSYVVRFKRLSPEARAAFLARQGYARLADLLAHVLAWWKECYRALDNLVSDPDFQTPEYDVDVFNAVAVEAASQLEEAEVIEAFDAMRAALYKRIAGLPDEAFQDERIAQRLEIEIIGHLTEHQIN